MDRSATRLQIKTLRLNTPETQRQILSQAIAERLCAQPFFTHCQHLALYLPVGGEVDTRVIAETARAQGKHCYLPVLATDQANHLWFMPFDTNTRFVSNRFNIPEPALDTSRLIAAQDLDLVITPLVAFDPACHRIGMGAGFYDRTFAFLNTDPRPTHPHLCGLAYEFQAIEDTKPKPWDVSLNSIVTETTCFRAPA